MPGAKKPPILPLDGVSPVPPGERWVEVRRTRCCAVDFMNRLDSTYTKESIQWLKDYMDGDYNARLGTSTEGPRTLFLCVTHEKMEESLNEKLLEAGFEKLKIFKRRKASGTGNLILWCYEVGIEHGQEEEAKK